MKTKIFFWFIVCLSGFFLRLPDSYAAITVKASHPRLLNIESLTQDAQKKILNELRKQAGFYISEGDEEMLIKNAMEHISKSIKFKVDKIADISRGKNGIFVPVISMLII